MKQAFRLLLCLIFSIALSACSDNHQKNTGKYKPVVNPNPKYFITVHGRISPKLFGKVKLVWHEQYYSTNPKCQITTNELEGVVVDRQQDVYFDAKPNAEGYYSEKIPLDGYKPGYCGWQFIWLGYTVADYKEHEVARFTKPVALNTKSAGMTLRCKTISGKVVCKTVKFKDYAPYSDSINLNANYQYMLNIE